MCGICGVWLLSTTSPTEVRSVLTPMNDAIAHRGPDGADLWADDDGIGLGHRRLAIVGLGPQGHQPTSSTTHAQRGVRLTFNGEIYNHRDLQTLLRDDGVDVDSSSDTRVLVEWLAHRTSGRDLHALRGMFAFAAVVDDGQRRELHLVRDAMGQKPLYVAALGGQGFDRIPHDDGWVRFDGDLAFASEPKAITTVGGFDDAIDREMLDHVLRFGVVGRRRRDDEPATLYQHMWQVPAGTRWRFRRRHDGALEAKAERYFDLYVEARQAQHNPYAGGLHDAADDVEDVLRAAVHRRLMSEVPLGAFLSGGIDSSLIVALMREVQDDVQTFTIGFDEDSWVATDESDDAERIARHLGTHHRRLAVTGRDALDVVPQLARMYDFPFADVSAIPTTLVSAFARRHVTVSLSGDGADELFGGYARYGWTRSVLQTLRPLPRSVRRRLRQAVDVGAPVADTALADAVRRLLPPRLARRATSDTLVKLAALLAHDDESDVFRAFLTQWEDLPLVDGVTPSSSSTLRLPPGVDLEKRLMLLDGCAYLPDDILVKVDRASMKVALEARAPFLDVDVVQTALRLPTSLLLSPTENKRVLRRILERHLPPDAIDPGKRGFGVPLDRWLRHELRDWAEDLLDEGALRSNGLNADVIRRRWQQHLSGERSHHYALYNVLMVQDWFRQRRL